MFHALMMAFVVAAGSATATGTMATTSHAPMAMPTPAAQPKPSAAEAAFISSVSALLLAKYPTTKEAKAAGYIQLTRLEPTDHTYNYTTMTYDKIDRLHPNFLWFDRNNKLVGLDYEYPKWAWPKIPSATAYPVAASRWVTIQQHMHYAYRMGSGPVQTHGGPALPNLQKDPITAQELTADKMLPKGATLVWAHFHPACWDLGFWLVPNPNGAFADLNPNVK